MILGKEQRKFTRAVAVLILFAYDQLGVELTFGDAYRDPRTNGSFGKKKGYGAAYSVHKQKLAVDLNLFVNGEYVIDSSHPVWDRLHIEWTSLGGSEFIPGDMNHFSFQYGDYR